jgi:NAD(P)H-dependent flavin oxidoreductase YrpB (nitropropane dioxygenase family)
MLKYTDELGRDSTVSICSMLAGRGPQIADVVKVPIIAAGGIAEARGIVAALALGASAVQIGTTYLFCPEARVPPLHLEALRNAADDDTMITNVFTGRPARGITNRLMFGSWSDGVNRAELSAREQRDRTAQGEIRTDRFARLYESLVRSGRLPRAARRASG